MEQFLKYYWLEREYLEKEIKPAFDANGELTAEQLFAIIFWKSKRRADLVRAGLRDKSGVRLLTEIRGAQTKEERLKILFAQEGFGIPMASAVLTILYPEDFTVYDYRLLGAVNEDCFRQYRERGEKIKAVSNPTGYWRFVEVVKQIADANKLSLRDCDRALWAKSWYRELKAFVSVEKPVGQSGSGT